MNYYDENTHLQITLEFAEEKVTSGRGRVYTGYHEIGATEPIPERTVHMVGTETKQNPQGRDRIIPAVPASPILEECYFLHTFSAEERIAWLKEQLSSTDYTVIKIAEGSASREQYADVIAKRESWRDEINHLEAEGIEYDD